MQIIIKEENNFMPSTIIKIFRNKIEIEENKITRILRYTKVEIVKIIELFLSITKNWQSKYIDKAIIDDEVYTISVINKQVKEYYIKNKYPNNWNKFILFRNKLVREELNF